jgi:uncharacterized protein (TIGR00725 family)
MSAPRRVIALIGGHAGNASEEALSLAEELGAEIGRRDMALICGGYNGVMEAGCRGCKKSGGVTIGVLKGNSTTTENPYVDYAIATSMDVASNNIIIWSGAGVVACDGGYGTLNEIALALDFCKPLVLTGSHPLLNISRIRSAKLAHFPGYDTRCIVQIIDRLVSMIDNPE